MPPLRRSRTIGKIVALIRMTSRERFHTVCRGKKPDRMPFWFGSPRSSTFAAWRLQGLSEFQQAHWVEFVGEEGFQSIGKLDFGPLPRFPEIILKEEGNERTWIDHYGVRRVDAIRQPTTGFATRRYLEFPVKDRASFWEYAKRYEATTAERYCPIDGDRFRESVNPDGYRIEQGVTHWRENVVLCNEGDVPVSLTVPGLWWTLRDWCGFEGLCFLCADDPDLVAEMMRFWTEFLIECLREPLSKIRLDHVMINEDMAYKTAPMLSPVMMRKYMLPNYLRLKGFFRDYGVDFVTMDTDGHCSEVIDVFFPEGIDGIAPMEIAANNDPEKYLRSHPKLVIHGGIDKRELQTTRERVRTEVARRYALTHEFPNYIPTVDHGVPPDVPLRNFLYMVELIRGFAQGESIELYEPNDTLIEQLGPIQNMFDPKTAYAKAYNLD